MTRKRQYSKISKPKVEEEVSETRNETEKNKTNQSPEAKVEKGAKRKKNRCGVCKKRIGLTGFACRCGGLYCGIHRYAEKHDCTYDYKGHGAEEIRRNNPVVAGEKIKKI